jgi:hypothetical protein
MGEERGEGGFALDLRQQVIRDLIETRRLEIGLQGAGDEQQARRGNGGDKNRAALGEGGGKGWLRQNGGQFAGRGSRRIEIHEEQRLYKPYAHAIRLNELLKLASAGVHVSEPILARKAAVS